MCTLYLENKKKEKYVKNANKLKCKIKLCELFYIFMSLMVNLKVCVVRYQQVILPLVSFALSTQ